MYLSHLITERFPLSNPKKFENPSNTDLTNLVRKWKEILRLLDWDIYVRFADTDEDNFDHAKQLGRCATNTHRKIAHITFQHPDNYSKDIDRGIEDFEQTIIHEMLHIPTSMLRLGREECATDDALYEQFIDQMATLLLRLEKDSVANMKVLRIPLVSD
jgi:hypothetical protein